MRKAHVVLVSLLCLTLAFSVFVFTAGTQAKMAVQANGKALWDYLKKENYAKNWKMWPGKEAFYPGQEPHGALLTTYVNKTAYMAIEGKKGQLPDGRSSSRRTIPPTRNWPP